MAEVVLEGAHVRVRLSGRERVLALHGDLVLPRSSVVSVQVVEDAMAEVDGLRAPGTSVPWRFKIGTWRHLDRAPDFVVARAGEPGLVLEVRGGDYGRVVVGMRDSVTARELALKLLA